MTMMVRLGVCHYEGIGLQSQGFNPVISIKGGNCYGKNEFH